MKNKLMVNYLELSYSPICNYDFSLIKDDLSFQESISNSSIYIIAQRNELTFNLIDLKLSDERQIIMNCNIKQKGNKSELNCRIPLYQKYLANDINKELQINFEYALPKPDISTSNFSRNNVRNIILKYHNDNDSVWWLSPEKLIQNWSKGFIEGEILGPLDEFIKYHVHYVGKATEQSICKRLTGHSTLQQILSIEYPLTVNTLPTHEISILLFNFKESFNIHTISNEDKITNSLLNIAFDINQPSEKTILLDAEKALIKAMQPKYNKEYYKKYPKSKDGLHSYNLDHYSFQIYNKIILQYEGGEISGSSDFLKADSILVSKNEPLQIIKNTI